MTSKTVKAVIKHAGGPEYILGMRFANGYKLTYSSHLIDPEVDFVEIDGVELLIYEHKDFSGKRAKSYLEVEEIVQIYARESLEGRISVRDFME